MSIFHILGFLLAVGMHTTDCQSVKPPLITTKSPASKNFQPEYFNKLSEHVERIINPGTLIHNVVNSQIAPYLTSSSTEKAITEAATPKTEGNQPTGVPAAPVTEAPVETSTDDDDDDDEDEGRPFGPPGGPGGPPEPDDDAQSKSLFRSRLSAALGRNPKSVQWQQ